jgi:hypothetical protein
LSSKYQFPNHYPEGCPPVDTELPGEYLHLVPHADRPPRKRDFYSCYEKGKGKDLPDSEACSIRGISIHTDERDLQRLLRLWPKMQERCIIRIKLPGGHGVVQHTPSEDGGPSHHDWWVPVGVDACSYFDSHVGGPFP